jgi:hypothetical protein
MQIRACSQATGDAYSLKKRYFGVTPKADIVKRQMVVYAF